MAELKTKRTDASVDKYLASIKDATQREDAKTLCGMFSEVTKESPKMWGSAIIGFGSHTLVYPNGRELDWMLVGFSPRKANLTLYLSLGGHDHDALTAKLGKHKTGKGCLYIKQLEDVDAKVLKNLIKQSVAYAKKK
jgi:hypothetical protein